MSCLRRFASCAVDLDKVVIPNQNQDVLALAEMLGYERGRS